MKRITKNIIGMATIAIIATPAVAVVSCGTEKASSTKTGKIIEKNSPFSKANINTILNDRFTKKLVATKYKGAIAETSDQYHNPVFPKGYKGVIKAHDILLENDEAAKIIKNSIKESKDVYLANFKNLKIVDGVSSKAYLKNKLYQYYVISSWALKATKEKTDTPKVTNASNENIIINPKKVGQLTYNNSNSYYQEAQGLKGQALFDKLHEIQGKHTTGIVSGSRGYSNLYNTYKIAFKDDIFENDNSVIDIYSENPGGKDPYNYTIGKNGSNYKHEGDMYNREHIVPQSWFGKRSPMRNDAQFVWPSDGKVNGVRSNYPHAPVNNVTWTSKNKSLLGTNAKYGGIVFEPIDEFKGDIARSYLYFALTYNQAIIDAKQTTKVFTHSFPYMSTSFLELYIKWAKEDPVSKFDIQRNSEVAKIQGNRNPFIDYPDLIDSIWGPQGKQNPTKAFNNEGTALHIK